jgi:type I restriction enzyme S subunit
MMMNPDWLLKHFDQISEAPDAVPRLRRFILDLAVRGKLVEQDPTDEPASELLKRIDQEKTRLIKADRIRKEKPLPPVDENGTLLRLPASWKWVPIRKITADRGQKIPNKKFSYIDVSAIDKERGLIATPQVLTPEAAPSRARKIVQKGDVIYSCVRPYLLNIAVIEDEFKPEPIVSTAFAVLNGLGFVLPRYLWLVLRSPFFVGCVEGRMRGQAYPAINDGDFATLPFPLPPLAEQYRIVAKVDELMALCDELEGAQAKRERRRDQLVAATLHGLNNGDDSSEPGGHPTFEESARFYFNHLPSLTTRPEHIHQLRQTILNLAVRGKLVWQDTKQQALTVESLEVPFYLPASWRWKTIGDLGKTQTGSTPPTVERQHYDGNIPFIKPAAISGGVINYEGQCLTESGVRESTLVHAGAILMVCIGGSIGKAALVTRPVCFNQQINSVSPTEGIDAHYLLFAMQSPYFRACVVNAAAQGTLPIISKGKWERLLIPVPPLAEQHQIVAKVDELMALCDELERRLTTTSATRRQLLEATLQEALDCRSGNWGRTKASS